MSCSPDSPVKSPALSSYVSSFHLLRQLHLPLFSMAPACFCCFSRGFFVLACLMLAAAAAAEEGCLPRTCGKLKISDPFWIHYWGMERRPPCGPLDFEVICFDETIPVLQNSMVVDNSSGLEIKDIFYEEGNRSLRVVDRHKLDDLNTRGSGRCIFPPVNTSVKVALPFQSSPSNRNLIFYNCTKAAAEAAARQDPKLVPIQCTNASNMLVRFRGRYNDSSEHDGIYYLKGCNSTFVPALDSSGKASASDYKQLISHGFLLTWKPSALPPPPPQPLPPLTRSNHKARKVVIIIGSLGGVSIVFIGLFLWFKRKRRKQSRARKDLLHSGSSMESYSQDFELGGSPHIFTFEELEEATNGFCSSRELGDGGFGTVYKGKLQDGRVVAVKRLYKNNYRRVEQFLNEVKILSGLLHQNLVILYGCTSRSSRDLLLVYEYIPNGTVADHLHGPRAAARGLTWPLRMSIAIETAEALSYLHAIEIIHRDVKTTNILLDDAFHVKVADFGLSRLFPLEVTHVSTVPQGTPGYLDPVYHQCYQLTDKSDVYSFGVVLVELISSKPAVDMSRSNGEINLASMALNRIQNHEIVQLVDPELGYDTDAETKRMIDLVAELAFLCLQLDRELRPSIKEVVEVLNRIRDGECPARNAPTKDDARLLNNSLQYSPDSVIHRFHSQSTNHSAATSNAAGF